MMTSLFSMFDPTALFTLQMNWTNMTLSMIILPMLYWNSPSRNKTWITCINNTLNKEFSSLFTKKILFKGSTLLCMSLFLFILMNNITSNLPYTFCCSAHLVFSASIALPLWVTIIMFYWTNLTTTMLSHLVPNGTPNLLMPVMVTIELTSNLIRPMALAIRLSANLIAGHLLMALLGNTLYLNNIYWPMICALETGFIFFEFMVAMIQAYVFSVLMTLYSSEIS